MVAIQQIDISMKRSYKGSPRIYLTWLASAVATLLTAFLLRDWLGISSLPFDLHAGWKAFTAWSFLMAVLSSRFNQFLSVFNTPAPASPQRDLYAEVEREMEAERHA